MEKKLSLLLVALLFLYPLPGEAKKKKAPKEPPRIYNNQRVYSSSCDAVWAAALPLLTEIGLAPASMDRQGGFVSLRWTKGQNQGMSSENDVKQLTVGYTGFWANYEVFRIDTGTFLIMPEGDGCRCQMKMSYVALQKPLFGQYQWLALESNNFLEESLLAKFEEPAKQHHKALANKAVQTQLAAQSTTVASVSVVSTPSGAEIELDRKFVGSTPSKFDVPPGKHRIQIRKSGHKEWDRSIDLLPGANINLSADLVAGIDEPKKEEVVRVEPPPSALQATPVTVQVPEAPAIVQTTSIGRGPRIVCPENVRQVPFSSSRPDIKSLGCGQVIEIVSDNGAWVKVRTLDGVEGNVSSKFIGR